MRRATYQRRCLRGLTRKNGTVVWEYRWRELDTDGTVTRRSVVIGDIKQYPTESQAQRAVDRLRLTINQSGGSPGLRQISFETLVNHYREHELPDVFLGRKPVAPTEEHKSYATQYAYENYLQHWILPRWKQSRVDQIKAVQVESWLKNLCSREGVQLANGTRAKIRNIMSAIYSHAIRWEWIDKNPITSVRQSAKRRNPPDILSAEELTAFLNALPEPLRTAVEVDAFTGLRRGELIGLQWQDVDFEKLVIHVRRSIVLMVEGPPKTEASRKDVPLDAILAESLLRLRGSSPYRGPTNWVFASHRMKGRQPLWPESLWRRYGKPAVRRAGISKRVGWHTFRHSYTTLLKDNGEDIKVVQELLRHANARVTMDVYAQAMMPAKRAAQSKLVRMVLRNGEQRTPTTAVN
jgi:integrase